MIKQHIEHLIQLALRSLLESGEIPVIPAFTQIEPTKDKRHGDFTCNAALILAKHTQKKSIDIARRIIDLLPPSPDIETVTAAGPGFINFTLSFNAYLPVLTSILQEKQQYGRCAIGRNKHILVEFVSSNPTGPLHVGHGRHAVFGSIVANLLEAVGFKVTREYYVNDAGRQMDILTVSVWWRYLAQCGVHLAFPASGYQGNYLLDIAGALYQQHSDRFSVTTEELLQHLPADIEQTDPEIYIDKAIAGAKHLLGEKYQTIYETALASIMADIKEDLDEFGVYFDQWFSEKEFSATGQVEKALAQLGKNGQVYLHEGATWFRSTQFGDTKDRVLVRSNGQRTYFANDVAYHFDKFSRGVDIALDIFGSDHHGYLLRMKAALKAMDILPERLQYLLVQFVTLYRGKTLVPLSTRTGQFVTLRELRAEVGNDAARFFYVMRKAEQPMDFDLELAKSRSNENPVYYVQYAHARICSVFKTLAERKIDFNEEAGLAKLHLLVQQEERQLFNTLSRYTDMIVDAALSHEPYWLTHYLRELAADFHTYYNAHAFLVDEADLRNARLTLISAVKRILLNGFHLLGISAPESM